MAEWEWIYSGEIARLHGKQHAAFGKRVFHDVHGFGVLDLMTHDKAVVIMDHDGVPRTTTKGHLGLRGLLSSSEFALLERRFDTNRRAFASAAAPVTQNKQAER